MKARYEAAEASSTVSEAMTATGEEFEDVGRAIERAEEQTEDMEARSAALDELHESGAFDNVLSDKDSIDRELEELSTDSGVEAELETLKSDVGAEGPNPSPNRRRSRTSKRTSMSPNSRISRRTSTTAKSRPNSQSSKTRRVPDTPRSVDLPTAVGRPGFRPTTRAHAVDAAFGCTACVVGQQLLV